MKNDIAFANADFIPDAETYPDRWADDARAFRELEAAIGRARLNHAYGEHPREKMDLFYPAGRPQGLVIFIHGGYWRRFDRTDFSHFARGLTVRDWAVAMPSYPLAPDVPISRITESAARAVDAAAALVAGPIRLTGYSAGGHLAARAAMQDTQVSSRTRVEKLVMISPVTDLRPLLETTLNDTLQLDLPEAVAESPVTGDPPECPTTLWVGTEERPVFLDQSRNLAQVWSADLRLAAGRHHFDILDDLEHGDSPLVTSILGPS